MEEETQTQVVDSRSNSTGEISTENSVPEVVPGVPTTTGVPLPPGLRILTPEEVAAAEDAVPEEQDETQVKAMIDEAYKKAEEQEKKIKESLAELGVYMLIRFEHPISIRHTVTLSEVRPTDRAMIAVLRERLSELEAYAMRGRWLAADEADKEAENSTDKILHPGMNRVQRRGLKFKK